ncbi:MAG: capsule assembly Wzi family protein, partial [Chitinophagaceae bacterium]|nr:capsule assembly Wzi family protein [Chitinophagaceae bacterium]
MALRTLIIFLVVISYFTSIAQTTFIPLWAKEGWLLDRMEIKAGTHNNLNLSVVKPYMRKAYVETADSIRHLLLNGNNMYALTKVDQYNLDRFQANNSEYSRYDTTSMPGWKSRKDFLGFLWPTKGNMIEVNTKDFYLSINPAINQQQSIETDFDDRVFVNSKGVILRGLVAGKIGFHLYATDNQEQGPIQYRQFVDSNRAVPGAGFNKNFKEGTGRDYFDARGSVSWNVTNYVNMQFGFDQHFIGAGYRSLFLGNFAPPHLFLKFNTRIKKFNYTNIFSELYPPNLTGGDRLNPKQYSATHHLSFNATPWLNIGAFETVVFDELSTFRVQYLQPVIFLNTLLRDKESNTSSLLGFDFKANMLKHVQLYGQVLTQGFNGTEKPEGNESWASRFGFQGGVKYVDAFGLKNLDLQAEYNQVRPFMYSGSENQGSWTNYRQSMAHPLGANFREVIGILRYQPINKLYIFARFNYMQQGRDSARFNFGSNPRVDNASVAEGGRRLRDAPYPMFSGTG